jgi:hypothetical protein
MTQRNSPEKSALLHKGATVVQLDINTLCTIFVAGFNCGVNSDALGAGIHDSFHNTIEGLPVAPGADSWDIAHRITVVSDTNLTELKKALRVLVGAADCVPLALLDDRVRRHVTVALEAANNTLTNV